MKMLTLYHKETASEKAQNTKENKEKTMDHAMPFISADTCSIVRKCAGDGCICR